MSQTKIIIIKQNNTVPGAGVASVNGESGVITGFVKTSGAQTLADKTISGAANTLTNLPAAGILGVIPVANLGTGTPDGTKFLRDDGVFAVPAGGGGGTWGSITGTLSSQTDLQAALDLKPTMSGGIVPAANLGSGSSITTKFLRGDNTWQTISGGGDALTSNPLSQFAATTSAELRGVLSDETGTGAAVFATSPTLVTPALGTPSSGTLTSCTGLPVATGISGLGTGVATALAVANNAAGGYSPIDGTATLTNKRVTARITTITSNATPTVNSDNCDCVTITAQAAAITSMTTNLTGTPVNFDQLEYRIKDDGTARAITWGASFVAGPTALPTTTIISKALHVFFEYDSVQAKFVCMSSGSDA